MSLSGMVWLLANGCVGGEDSAGVGGLSDLALSTTASPTLLEVSWVSDQAVIARAAYDNGDGVTRHTPWESAPGTEHAFALLGVLPSVEFEVQAEHQAEDGTAVEVGSTTGTTEALALGTPIPVIASNAPPLPGLTLMPIVAADNQWKITLDEKGNVTDSLAVGRFEYATLFRAEPNLAQTGFWYHRPTSIVDEDSALYEMSFDGELRREIPLIGSHTDFIELPSGVIFTLGGEIREYGDRKMMGDRLIRIEPDGSYAEVWSVFEDFTPDLTRDWGSGSYKPDPTVEDWSHLNGLGYDEENDLILITATFIHGVLAVSPDGDGLQWTMADQEGDFTFSGSPDAMFAQPHSVQKLENGNLLVFNRGIVAGEYVVCSNAVELKVDMEKMVTDEVWRYSGQDCYQNYVMGSVYEYPEGERVLSWSALGQADSCTAEGSCSPALNLGLGEVFGFGPRTVLER